MEYKDYYKILGASKASSADDIKKQYRKSARKYHPDVNKTKDAEQKFKDIGEAYEVLKDPEKRKAYDQYGSNWKESQHQQHYQNYQQRPQGGFEAGNGFDFGSDFEDSGQFSDFFETLFGGGGRKRRQSYKGEDLEASISIPIEDSYTGVSRHISFQTDSLNAENEPSNRKINLNVKIPKGIKRGQKIRLEGQGAPGYNGEPAGDLLIKIDFLEHQLFYTNGSDVYMNLPVSAWEAALGSKIMVPIPTSVIKLNIPAGTAQGKKFRLKGKGIPGRNPGDLFVVINIVLPPADSPKAEKVYEAMKELDFNPRANIKYPKA